MKELAVYIGANSDTEGFCFCQFSVSYTSCVFVMFVCRLGRDYYW